MLAFLALGVSGSEGPRLRFGVPGSGVLGLGVLWIRDLQVSKHWVWDPQIKGSRGFGDVQV